MTRLVGKIRLDAGCANAVCFVDGALWVVDGWSGLGPVTPEGFVRVAEPARPRVLGGRDGRVAFSFSRTESRAGEAVDVFGVVLRDASLALGEELILASLPQEAGVYPKFIAASPDLSRFALLLTSNQGPRPATVVVWSEGRESARYERVVDTQQGLSVSGLAFSTDGASVLVAGGGALIRCPAAQGTPLAMTVDGFEAFASLGGAEHLPVASGRVLLHQYPHGALGLFTEAGETVFAHTASDARGYFTHELRRSVASMSADGRFIAAAVAAADAIEGKAVIEVFDAAGNAVRSIEWKCAKSEYASDVAIDDEGWIALATNKKLEVFAPEGHAPTKSKRRA